METEIVCGGERTGDEVSVLSVSVGASAGSCLVVWTATHLLDEALLWRDQA